MKNKNRKVNKLASLLLSLIMVFTCSSTVFAAETDIVVPDNREYLIVNGTDIVYVGEDYENPETGEYIRWNENARGVDKKFSFRIRYSVTSSDFTVSSSKVRVKVDADVIDYAEVVQDGYDGHAYTVSVSGVYSRNLQFSVGDVGIGTITDLKDGGTYRVTITNNDYLEYGYYLDGSGSITAL